MIRSRPVDQPLEIPGQGQDAMGCQLGGRLREGTASRPLRTIAKALDLAGPGARSSSARDVRRGPADPQVGTEDGPIIVSPPGRFGQGEGHPPRTMWRGIRAAQYHLAGRSPRLDQRTGDRRPQRPPRGTQGGDLRANGITWAGKAGIGCRATNNVVYGNVHCGLKEMGHGGTGILMEANSSSTTAPRDRPRNLLPCRRTNHPWQHHFQQCGLWHPRLHQARRQRIVQNICFGNRVCGIILAGSENQVYHNVCVGNGIGIFYFRGGWTENVVQNNIFAFNGTDSGYDNGGGKQGDPARNIDDYNCCFPGKPHARILAGPHEILADPNFVDAKVGDYRHP